MSENIVPTSTRAAASLRVLKRLTGLTNIGLRGASLVFRFILTFYIVKYLGYEATGLYGLTVATVGMMPALIGWGLNYFMARDIVGAEPLVAATRIKTRLLVTTLSLAVVTIGASSLLLALEYEFRWIYALIVVLVWLEVYAVDLHIALIALEKGLLANVLVFIRLALWVPFVIGFGLWLPALRTLEAVFAGWIASYVLLFACLLWALRDWPLAAAGRATPDGAWVRGNLRRSWFIYLSDIGLAGTMYVDRYIVSFMLGLTLTGIYTFYWSLTNALQTLISTAVVQLALPALYKAYNSGSVEGWRAIMRQQFVKTALLASVMAAGVFAVAEVAIRFMSMPDLAEHRMVFVALLLAAIIRACSDLFNVGLMSIKKDNHYATLNLVSIGLAAAMAYAMIELFGFAGTGIAALSTAVVVAAIRAGYLMRFSRSIAAAPSEVAAAASSNDALR